MRRNSKRERKEEKKRKGKGGEKQTWKAPKMD